MKIINAKKTKLYWIYYILAVFLFIGALIVAPVWNDTDLFFKNWGSKLLNILIAVAIFYYIIVYLFKKINSSKGAILILTIVEIVLLSLVALGSVLSQFKIINVSGPCQILGLALWLRGVIELVRAYYYRGFASKIKYSLVQLAIAIAMVTFGTYIFARPFISPTVMLWILVALLLVFGVYTLLYGISAKKTSKK